MAALSNFADMPVLPQALAKRDQRDEAMTDKRRSRPSGELCKDANV
jgi:hypothetical protein